MNYTLYRIKGLLVKNCDNAPKPHGFRGLVFVRANVCYTIFILTPSVETGICLQPVSYTGLILLLVLNMTSWLRKYCNLPLHVVLSCVVILVAAFIPGSKSGE